MADKKPLVAGQSPAVVQQISPADTLDVPEIKLGTPLAAQYGGLGVDPSGWTNGNVPAWNTLTSSFTPENMPRAWGTEGAIQYSDGFGNFTGSPTLLFDDFTGALKLYGELYVATGGGVGDPRMQMFAFMDKAGYAGLLRFRESNVAPVTEFKFTGTAIETPNEFRAYGLSVTHNASITQLGAKTSPLNIHGSKFTITTSSSSLSAGFTASFTINNNAIKNTDAMIFVSHVSGGTVGAYSVSANVTGTGTALVTIRNNTAGALAQALVLKGVVIG